MSKKQTGIVVPDEIVMNKIYLIRGQKVMLDRDLAELYNVETKRLKEAVKRNLMRFPLDFMFELTHAEVEFLRSQFATSKNCHTIPISKGVREDLFWLSNNKVTNITQ